MLEEEEAEAPRQAQLLGPSLISVLDPRSLVPGVPAAPVLALRLQRRPRENSLRATERTRLPQGCGTQRSPLCSKTPAMRFLSLLAENTWSPSSACGQVTVTATDVHHRSVLWEAEEGGFVLPHPPAAPTEPSGCVLFRCWGCSFQLFFPFLHITCHITCHLSLLSPAPPSIITISASNPQHLSSCPLSSLCPKQE